MNTSTWSKIFMNDESIESLPPLESFTLIGTSISSINKWGNGATTADWFAARNASSGYLTNDASFFGAGLNGGSVWGLSRAFPLFNLNSINGTIFSARIVIANEYISNIANFGSIQTCNNISTLTSTDFVNFIDPLLGYSNGKYYDFSGYFNIIEFNSAGIDKLNQKGIQRFVIRNGEYDYSNICPAITEEYTFGYTQPAPLPKLIYELI